MKRYIISLILTGLMICSICSCGKKEENVAEAETPIVEETTEEVQPTEQVKGGDSEQVEGEATEQIEETTGETESEEPWKEPYRNYLNNIIAGKDPLPDLLEVVFYSPDSDIRFATQDITGDGTPELFVSGVKPDEYHYWGAWTLGSDGKINPMGGLSYYNPDTKEAYVSDGSSFESYSVYSLDNDSFIYQYMVGETDRENPYYKEDKDGTQTEISNSDMEAFRSGFYAGLEKYGIKGIELTQENIDKEFGNSSDNTKDTNGDAESLLDNFIKGKVPAYRHDEFTGETSSFMISDLSIDEDDIYTYHIGEQVDLDNDGERELILEDVDGGMYLDAYNGKVNVFAASDGSARRLSYVDYEDAVWIVYSDTSHGGRQTYEFYKFDGDEKITDSFDLSAEYWDSPNDMYDENSDFSYRGHKISMQEYEELISKIFK